MSLTKKLRGTGVALITPFTEKGKIDFHALEKIINHLISGKCEYIVVLGTTGESATLSEHEKTDLSKHIVTFVKDRIPLVLGLGGNNTMELISQLKNMDMIGYDAILSVSPYYNKPTQDGIYKHYAALAAASSLPLLIYNVPARTGSNITAETTLKLAQLKNIIGIKEASGNIEQCMQIIREKPKDFLVISGDDSITLPLIACGADGVISVVANAFPETFSSMVRFALAGNFDKARILHYNIFPVIPMLFDEGNPAGVKAALASLELCGENVRLPLIPVSKKLFARIKAFTQLIKN
jgi:4-hydroxy-tetrahydrodipicolinate synthase